MMNLNIWLKKNSSVIIYGTSMAVLLFLLKWLEWRFVIIDHALELYAGCLALIFTLLGIWISKKLSTPKNDNVTIEKEVTVKNDEFIFNELEKNRRGISKRELEVLQLMADGLSNEEIASKLYVSLNTIKTHNSNIYNKLEVKRRTHAVDVAKKLNLIP